jgi:ribosomal-protein-serine acetyltransferase
VSEGPAAFRLGVDDEVELRLFEVSHAEALFRLVDANRPYLREWLSWLDAITTVDDQRAFIEQSLSQFAQGNPFSVGIWVLGDPIGVIGFVRFDRKNQTTEFGYWLASDVQGRGVMTRACRAFLWYAIDELGFNRVEIRCATGNARSAAIPERLGFRLEGTLRDAEWLYDHYVDHHVYAMLAAEWRAEDGARA